MIVDSLVRFFSSLRLTVVCLALATVLVFVGTMAQVEQGLYAVQSRYFQSFFVFWELPGTGLRIPVFPGGYLIGGVLIINLLVAYGVRFGLKRLRPGLILIHVGLVFLLLGQLWTDLSQQESVMQLAEGRPRAIRNPSVARSSPSLIPRTPTMITWWRSPSPTSARVPRFVIRNCRLPSRSSGSGSTRLRSADTPTPSPTPSPSARR
ncbi:MAG: hypothetical protein M5U12_00425 [Verrucomicrobia bacterium]|nr:hypothetical protein [Verrucomicrobiota bacterium]